MPDKSTPETSGESIAIVGLACRFPDAADPAEFLELAVTGRRAFRRIPPVRLDMADYAEQGPDSAAQLALPFDLTSPARAGLLEGWRFDRAAFGVTHAAYRAADPAQWLALETTARALTDGGFPGGQGLPRDRTGVIIGNTLTGDVSRADIIRSRWPYVRRVLRTALAAGDVPPELSAEVIEHAAAGFLEPFPEFDSDSAAGSRPSAIADRICGHFGFRGGGHAVDAAHSSSLLAIASACSALAAGEIDAAVTGGVDISLDPFELLGMAVSGTLAAHDMRVFDSRPTGFWPGEGCGLVVLMRTADARAAGVPAYAEIAGWGISSAGSPSVNRPGSASLLLALRRAYHRAGIDPADVQLIEGDGTGTAAGDLAELTSLAEIRQGAPSLAALSSVKASIGHTKAAAGAAGLIKATLAVAAGIIPPAAGCVQPHPLIASSDARLRAPRTAEAWPERDRLAGVNSVGPGGTSVHVILRRTRDGRRRRAPGAASLRAAGHVVSNSGGTAPLATGYVTATPARSTLFPFSGSDRRALASVLARVADLAPWLSDGEFQDLASQAGRWDASGEPVRTALLAKSQDHLANLARDAVAMLPGMPSGALTVGPGTFAADGAAGRVAVLLPGEGSLETRADASAGGGAYDPSLQPAIVASSLAGLRWLDELNVTAAAGLGHGLGEVTALVWAGCLSEADATRLTAQRAKLLGDHPAQHSTLVSLDADSRIAERLCAATGLVIAARNGPRCHVLAGPVPLVRDLMRRLAEEGIPGTLLDSPLGYYSPAMSDLVAPLRSILREFTFRPPVRRLLSALTATEVTAQTDIAAMLCTQLTSPVLFADTLLSAAADVDLLVETGPGTGLTRLASDCCDVPAVSLGSGNGQVDGHAEVAAALFAARAVPTLAPLFAGGPARAIDIWRERLFIPSPCGSAPPPGTAAATPVAGAFGRRLPPPAAARTTAAAHANAGEQPDSARHGSMSGHGNGTERGRAGQHDNAGERGSAGDRSNVGERGSAGQHSDASEQGSTGERGGWQATTARGGSRDAGRRGAARVPASAAASSQSGTGSPAGPPPGEPQRAGAATGHHEDLTQAETDHASAAHRARHAQDPQAEQFDVDGVAPWVRCFTQEWRDVPAHAAAGSRPPGRHDAAARWRVRCAPRQSFGKIVSRVFASDPAASTVLAVVGDPGEPGVCGTLLEAARESVRTGSLVVITPAAGLTGFCASLHAENPALGVTLIKATATLEGLRAARRHAVTTPGEFRELLVEPSGRVREPIAVVAEPAADGTFPLGPADVVLVSALTRPGDLECATALASRGAALAVIAPPGPEDPRLAACLADLRSAGVRVGRKKADLTDPGQVAAAIRSLERGFGPVTAVVHAVAPGPVERVTRLADNVLRNYVAGQRARFGNVLGAVASERLRIVVTFGSAAALHGGVNAGPEALASGLLADQVSQLASSQPRCRVLHVDWGPWAETPGGAAASAGHGGQSPGQVQRGVMPVSVGDGTRLLLDLLTSLEFPQRVAVHGRYGVPAPSRMTAGHAPPARGRFTSTLRVHYPGVEVVADTQLSPETDPYLADYRIGGIHVFPPAMALEAMAQAAASVAGTPLRRITALSFDAPVIVPAAPGGEETVVRVCAVRCGSTVETVLRCSETGFRVDHARAIFGKPAGQSRDHGLPLDAGALERGGALPPLASASRGIVDGTDLYGPVLFQTGRFRRVAFLPEVTSRTCRALVRGGDDQPWFGAVPGPVDSPLVLGSPGLNDATLHVLAACVPHRRVLPTACESVTFSGVEVRGALRVAAVRRPSAAIGTRAGHGTWDVTAEDANGQIVATWTGLALRDAGPLPRAVPWHPALLAASVESRAAEFGLGTSLQAAIRWGYSPMPGAGLDMDPALPPVTSPEPDWAAESRAAGQEVSGAGRWLGGDAATGAGPAEFQSSAEFQASAEAERVDASPAGAGRVDAEPAADGRAEAGPQAGGETGQQDPGPGCWGDHAAGDGLLDGFAISVLAPSPVACRWRVVNGSTSEDVPLDDGLTSLLHRLGTRPRETPAALATRFRTIADCLTALGRAPGAPCTVESEWDDGWVVVRAGGIVVACTITEISGVPAPVALAIAARPGLAAPAGGVPRQVGHGRHTGANGAVRS